MKNDNSLAQWWNEFKEEVEEVEKKKRKVLKTAHPHK